MSKVIILIFVIPFLTSFLIYFKFKKLLWLSPVIIFVLELIMLFRDIINYQPEETFKEQIRLFFHNDAVISLYILYFPMIITSIIFTLVFQLIIRQQSIKK